MRRQAKPYCEYDVFRTKPLFVWRKCRVCKNEFRRENGWRIIGPPFIGNSASVFYMCSKCAETQEDAERIAMERPWVGKRPQFPGQGNREEAAA